MGVDDKAYETWSKELDDAKLSPYHLLLPIKKNFSTKGLCGSSGTLTVQIQFKFSSTMKIIHIYSVKKSITAMDKNHASIKLNYGSFSITSLQLKEISPLMDLS